MVGRRDFQKLTLAAQGAAELQCLPVDDLPLVVGHGCPTQISGDFFETRRICRSMSCARASNVWSAGAADLG
jgi:hypothetical protein